MRPIVTNLETDSRAVVRFYNKWGTAEQWIKEGKQAVSWMRLSCHRFRSNEVRLWLSVIAYNLGNLWRRLAVPRRIGDWSLTSLQQRLVKTSGRLVKHARYYWMLLAEGHLSRSLFGSMLRIIAALPLPLPDGWRSRNEGQSAKESSNGDKGQQGGRLEAGKKPRRAAERPKRAAMPHKRHHAIWGCRDKAAGVSFRGDKKLKSEIPG